MCPVRSVTYVSGRSLKQRARRTRGSFNLAQVASSFDGRPWRGYIRRAIGGRGMSLEAALLAIIHFIFDIGSKGCRTLGLTLMLGLYLGGCSSGSDSASEEKQAQACKEPENPYDQGTGHYAGYE